MSIHPTAIIDSQAEIHPECEIGPFVVIEGPVKIRRGTRGWRTRLFLAGRKSVRTKS
jgi:acyl-[acyl carrier protein]--UDP-N-acetylglucosamine O-acyltransferase